VAGASLVSHGGDALFADIVRTLRLPRALAGFACGALLALAGALLQVLLRNRSRNRTCSACPAARPASRSSR
jgi:ABC-type Fe3+-siderophore transport system permease subunit